MKYRANDGKRGISLIAVLGILVLLVFLVGTMYYMVTLESRSTYSYAQRVQNRYDPKAPQFHVKNLIATVTSSTISNSKMLMDQAAGIRTNTGVVEKVDDLSGRVNLNSVRDAEAFDRFVRAAMIEADGDTSKSFLAKSSKKNIAGEGIEAPHGRLLVAGLDAVKKRQARVSEDPKGGGTASRASTQGISGFSKSSDSAAPFQAVGDATKNAGDIPAVFSKAEIETMAPYLTAVSESKEFYALRSGKTGTRLSLDALTSNPLAVWKQLAAAYPDKNPRLLMQYAVNLVDYFDDNTTPTMMYADAEMSLDKAVVGVEPTVMISEVYPDSRFTASEGDGGQFVELYNPWNERVVLPGWKLEIYGTSSKQQPDSVVTLSAALPPNGVLVVTNNYNRREGAGSSKGLFTIFGVEPDGTQHQVYEISALALPDFGGMAVLRDQHDSVIDIFKYGFTGAIDSMNSFRREDPTVRSSSVGAATPFAIPSLLNAGCARFMQARASARMLYADKGCVSPMEMLRVSTAFCDIDGQQQAHPWQVPVYNAKDAALDKDNFDETVADLFIAGTPRETADVNDNMTTYTRGKLNVNTCSSAALLSIDARIGGQFAMTPAVWENIISRKKAAAATGENAFVSASEFVKVMIPNLASEDDFNAAVRVLDQICVSSSSYAVQTGAWRKTPPKKGMPLPGRQCWLVVGGPDGQPKIAGTSFE